MKIAVITSSCKKAGPIIVAADQIKLLTQLGHQCKLFFFDDCADELDFPCEKEKISLKIRSLKKANF